MKKNTFKFLINFSFTLFSFVLAAQTAPDEDTNSNLSCSTEYKNATITSSDYSNPVNVGTIDDRSCYSDYSESDVYGKTWGVYNITDGSNHFGGTLQPRIERSLSRSQETGVGSYAKFKGTFRILEVGNTTGTNSDGTYIAQAKGGHTGGGGSADPAICLYLAKPVYGTGADVDKQVSFDIYAERILYRGGEGSGREIVFLKNVLKNEETNFELEVGFREDPNDVTKKKHYCDAVIGEDVFNWNIPEPEKGTQSGIRYGAYRVKGGRAQIRWANTTYQKAEVVDSSNPGTSDDIYRLRNVATGKFLTAVGNSATPVIMTDSGEDVNTRWTFVESGAYFNIDSEDKSNGIDVLRAINSDPYLVVSTGKDAPTTDTDKSWTIHHNETEDTYRFESRFGKYLYHQTDGSVYQINVPETDPRSKWEVIPTSESLSVSNKQFFNTLLKVYPNPTQNSFTIELKNTGKSIVNIIDVVGKVVYTTNTLKRSIKLSKENGLSSGLFFINVQTSNGKEITKKLIIK